MTHFVNNVRKALNSGCIVNKLRKEGCKVSLAGAPAPNLIVDFDKPGSPLRSSSKRCDYLFIAKGKDNFGLVAPLELMKGRLDAAKVVGQLQEGASAAERLTSPSEPIRLRPIAVTGGTTPKAEREKLKQQKRIRLHRCVEAVRLLKCGDTLVQKLRT